MQKHFSVHSLQTDIGITTLQSLMCVIMVFSSLQGLKCSI